MLDAVQERPYTAVLERWYEADRLASGEFELASSQLSYSFSSGVVVVRLPTDDESTRKPLPRSALFDRSVAALIVVAIICIAVDVTARRFVVEGTFIFVVLLGALGLSATHEIARRNWR